LGPPTFLRRADGRDRAALLGCGETARSVTPTEVEGCLKRAGVETGGTRDLIAEEAGLGSVVAECDRNRANVVIERSEGDAESTAREYEAFIENPDERLMQEGSVVVAWDKTPTDRETRTLEGCLED